MLTYTEPEKPKEVAANKKLLRKTTVFVVTILFSPVLLVLFIARYSAFTSIFSTYKQPSIKSDKNYKHGKLIEQVWSTPVGQAYLKGGLEYQPREGFCAPSTVRNVIKSIPGTTEQDLPPLVSGPSVPEKLAVAIDKCGRTESQIIYGQDGFDAFKQALKHSNDPNYRLSANFLRGPLFGPIQDFWFPSSYLVATFGGHFSPVIGYLEKEELVAVFDLNHNYSMFLVDTKRFYESVNTMDIMTGQNRALILSKNNKLF